VRTPVSSYHGETHNTTCPPLPVHLWGMSQAPQNAPSPSQYTHHLHSIHVGSSRHRFVIDLASTTGTPFQFPRNHYQQNYNMSTPTTWAMALPLSTLLSPQRHKWLGIDRLPVTLCYRTTFVPRMPRTLGCLHYSYRHCTQACDIVLVFILLSTHRRSHNS
jgi:hypothetical protein